MLVLSRCKDESIMIGQNVQLTIVDVQGERVRVGITAPQSIPVHRKEVYEAICREKNDKARRLCERTVLKSPELIYDKK